MNREVFAFFCVGRVVAMALGAVARVVVARVVVARVVVACVAAACVAVACRSGEVRGPARPDDPAVEVSAEVPKAREARPRGPESRNADPWDSLGLGDAGSMQDARDACPALALDLAVPFPEFMAAVDAQADRLGLPNSDAMVVPSEAERDAFAVAVTKALAGQCSLLPAPYKVARWQGPPGPQGAQGETLRVVAEMGNDGRPTPLRFWGTYALREPASAGPDRGTRLLAIEAPHPLYDVHTSEEAAHLFGATRARYFLEAGGDRCISRVQSACSGTSDVCGPKGPYRVSDAAHAVIHPFFAVHRLLSETEPQLHFLQLHGNSEPSCPDVLLSDASGDWDEQGATAALARALAQRSVSVGRCGKDYPKGPCDLCGGGNVEARVTAQSTDACRRGGRSYGRFLHLEQSRAFRATPSPTQAGYGPLIDAVNDAFPETR